MLRGITFPQLLEWIAYASLEPFDELRADYRAASIVAMLANINRDPKKRSQPFTLDEVLVRFGEKEARKQKSEAEMKAIYRLMYEALKDNK